MAIVVFVLLGLVAMLAILLVLRRRRMPLGYLFGVLVLACTLILGAATSLQLWREWVAFDHRQRSSIDYMLERGAVLEAGNPSGTEDRLVKLKYPDDHKYAGSAATIRLWPFRYDWLAAWAPALALGVVCGVVGCGLRVITDRLCRQRSRPRGGPRGS